MKKLIAILVVFAVITGAAFAQMAGGMFANAWGQGVFAPLMIQSSPLANGEKIKDGDDKVLGARTFVGMGPDWGWSNEFGGGITVGAWSEGVGFSIGLEPTGNEIYGNIWAKPFNGSDAFKITIGAYTEDIFRGKTGPGGRNGDFVLPGMFGEDYIFSRLGTDTDDGCLTHYKGNGFMFSSVPVDGLFLAWNVNVGHQFNPDPGNGANRRANDAFRSSQVAIGYNISGIGLVRAMYLGGWAGKLDLDKEKTYNKLERADYKPNYSSGSIGSNDQSSIQMAFAITAIEGITIDIGYRFFIPITIWNDLDGVGGKSSQKLSKFSNGHWIGAGVDMSFGIFGLRLFGAGVFGGYTRNVNEDSLALLPYSKDKSRKGLELAVKIDPSLSLDFGTIGLSLAYKMQGSAITYSSVRGKFDGKNADGKFTGYTHQIGMGLWYERGLGSGNFTIALTYTTPKLQYSVEHEKPKMNGSHWIQVPITLTYAFF